MTSYYSLFLLLFSVIMYGQQESFVVSLQAGDVFDQGSMTTKFIKVVSDSRCPKNVQCIWAGKAEVLLGIYKEGKEIDQKVVTISSVSLQPSLVYASDVMALSVLNLAPYPVSGNLIKPEDYVLELLF